jgi:hypothetical protein
MIRRRRFHRAIFCLAGAYNIGWGIYTICDPQWFFRFSRMAPDNHPEIFVCLGMVIGLYGLLYWDVWRAPENGWRIAALGLLGKILGPVGMLALIVSGRWPARAMVLCLTNDLIWWIPFALYLYDAFPWRAGHFPAATTNDQTSNVR